jgi:hypothetical protein
MLRPRRPADGAMGGRAMPRVYFVVVVGGGESLETAGGKAALRGGGDDDAPDGWGIELLEWTKTRGSAGSSQQW